MEKKYRNRAWVLAIIGALFALIFMGRLYFLQVVYFIRYCIQPRRPATHTCKR